MDYSKTLNLPQTEFPMRGNLPQSEPAMQQKLPVQEESLQLDASKPATIRCKWRSGTLCGISESLTVEVRNSGDDEVI